MRRRQPPEIVLTGYRVSEFAGETGIPKNVVLDLIRDGRIKADRTGKRWWRIPYSERARIETLGEAPAA